MVFRNRCVPVHWTKEASALEGLGIFVSAVAQILLFWERNFVHLNRDMMLERNLVFWQL